jgi:hypothetical protein
LLAAPPTFVILLLGMVCLSRSGWKLQPDEILGALIFDFVLLIVFGALPL